MPSTYRVVVEEIVSTPAGENSKQVEVANEIFAQTFAEINLPHLIRALNPVTRKRKGKPLVKAE